MRQVHRLPSDLSFVLETGFIIWSALTKRKTNAREHLRRFQFAVQSPLHTYRSRPNDPEIRKGSYLAERKLLRNIPRSIQRRVREFLERNVLPYPVVFALNAANRSSSHPVTAPGGPEVSITTYGKRVHSVHLTLESIARGQMLPSRLILWLDDPGLLANLPEPLLRLKRRGLEIELTDNYGPHTKYYPYVATRDTFPVPMVTGDDDQLYRNDWLALLVDAHRKFPDCVNAYLAKRARIQNGTLDLYANWVKCSSTEARFSQIALGVSGVIYPPALLAALKAAGTEFLGCCPKADDLWLHVQAVRAGFKIRQISAVPKEFLQIPGSQRQALWMQNCEGAGNDVQIQATYRRSEIVLFEQESSQP